MYLVANLAPGLLSILFKRKCLAIGAGIADRREISRTGRVLARFVLNRIEKVCVRDRGSLRNALAMGLKEDRLLLAADLAFHLGKTERAGDTRQGEKVLFCPRFTKIRKGRLLPASMMKRFNHKEYQENLNGSAGRFAELLKRIAEEFDVILLPCYSGREGGGKDRAFSEKILELSGYPSNVEVYDGSMDFNGIRELIKQTFVTVGVPVHALILTSIMHNPAIAISYASKCSSFMKEVGLEQYVVSIPDSSDEFSSKRLIELIRSCRFKQREISTAIKERVKELCRRNRVNYDAVINCLPNPDIV
jgi:polysaccharide pyruvyl transferase WcaK-like protein